MCTCAGKKKKENKNRENKHNEVLCVDAVYPRLDHSTPNAQPQSRRLPMRRVLAFLRPRSMERPVKAGRRHTRPADVYLTSCAHPELRFAQHPCHLPHLGHDHARPSSGFPAIINNLRENDAASDYVLAMIQSVRTFGWRDIALLSRDCALETAQPHFQAVLNSSEVRNAVGNCGLVPILRAPRVCAPLTPSSRCPALSRCRLILPHVARRLHCRLIMLLCPRLAP